jgi:hypothetical protein
MKRLSLLSVTIVLIASCGGGGGGSDPVVPASSQATTPTSAAGIKVIGKVLFDNGVSASGTSLSMAPHMISPTASFAKLQTRSLESVTGPSIALTNNLDQYLCYSALDLELASAGKDLNTILEDIDVDDDGIPDINISFTKNEQTKAFKNISVSSFKFDLLPTPEEIASQGFSSLEEMFPADHFLFDIHNNLEANIDTDGDGIPDQNITVDFVLDEIPIKDEPQIFYNIKSPDSDLMINVIVDPLYEQYEDISLINHDVNFDGQPDINLDLNFDNIAETQLDADGDCLFDYSIVEATGASVSGANIELREVSDSDGDGGFDTISDEVISVISDSNGDFVFEDIVTGKSYILTITKDRGEKIVWNKLVITIPNGATLEYDLGAYALTSAPIVVGIETSLKENKNIVGVPLYGKHDYSDTIEMDFEIGKTWYFKFYIEDINNSDVYRNVPYRDGNNFDWLYKKLMFIKPNESQSGFYEMTYEYELREDGCFHVTLNSYSPLWQDQGYDYNFCTMDQKEFEKGDSFDSVASFRDIHYINNSDDVDSAYDWDSSPGTDLFTRLIFRNANYNPHFAYGFEIESITINEVKYNWDGLANNGSANGIDRKSLNIISETDALSLNIKTKVDVMDTSKNIGISYDAGYVFDYSQTNTVIGDDVNLNLEEVGFPKYGYRIYAQFCLMEGIFDGVCRELGPAEVPYPPAMTLSINYSPNIPEKPAALDKLFINDIEIGAFLSSNVIEVGDTINLKAQLSDSNSLQNEVYWSFLNNVSSRGESDWISETESHAYTFSRDDIGNSFRIDLTWRNNDGVAKEWVSRDGVANEQDGFSRYQISISE